MVIWLSNLWLAEDTSIVCLDFDIGSDPFIKVQSLCLESADVDINISHGQYFIGSDWLSKSSYLNQASVSIDTLVVSHKQNLQPASNETDQNSDLGDLWTLPESLPLITMDNITIDSYLMEQPVSIHIFQPDRSQLAIRGDIEGNLLISESQGKGVISGDLNWSAGLILSKSQELENLVKPYKNFINNWQNLVESPIYSRFEFTGSVLTGQHKLSLNNIVNLQDCKLPVQLNGEIDTALDFTSWLIQVDLSRLKSNFEINQCAKIDVVNEFVKLDSWTLEVPKVSTFNEGSIHIPEINLISNTLANPLLLAIKDIELNNQLEARLNYHLSLNSSIAELLMNEQNANGKLQIAATGRIIKKTQETHINGTNLLQFSDVTTEFGTVEKAKIAFDFSLKKLANSPWQANATGSIEANDLAKEALAIHSISSDLKIDGDSIEQLAVQVKNNLQKITYNDFAAKSLGSNLSLNIKDIQTLSGAGKSKLQGITSSAFNLSHIDFKHDVNGQRQPFQLTGNHEITMPSGLLANLFHNEQTITLLMPEQSVTYLNPLVQQFAPELNLITGKIGVNLTNDNANRDFNGQLTINGLSGEYQDYQIINAQFDAPFRLDSSGIQLNHGKMTVEEINVGVPMTQIEAKVSMLNTIPKLDFAEARIIGGRVTLTDFWLDNRKQLLKLDIDDLDLNQLVELQNQEGIEVSGAISGDLPIYWDSGFSTINQGILLNDGPGKLKITNNEAFNAIKEQQDQLAFLENVEFSKLSSEVSLSDDGWLDLKIGINGVNPDKQQEINFNYSHTENIFTLFKSMRITNSVQNSIEKRIQQRLSNKDKNL
ncbi:YdbH domain-containing protein [Aliiglaciecola sp. 3_MG-2023]|uniref:intermembrane phospholipid transport protein YdbH family protein n=1 Tax=Aliiglaciecola sp. 3_MG-2023 TaxID=3062644 RepID=UPI0026E3ECB3|nr:YdbH domain-containing protein [Aliiglaciecola sp. 3_MG-2023]MDO6692551.1 YdbH domain-containing protein [Aliiglaciecola sp. 3_MG-2023]